MINITKKNLIIISLFLLLVIGISLFFILNRPYPEAETVYFTDEPTSWVSENINSDEDDDMQIDVHRATKTLSIVDFNKQEYYYYGKRITFFSHGVYRGIDFTKAYVLPEVIEEASKLDISEQYSFLEKNTAIYIGPEMNPRDGIINVFILGRVEETKFVFYIYVDEDWRSQLEYTNIIWGDDYTDKSTLNVRQFDFSESTNGIYVDKIDYDIGWIKKDTNGGIMVGEIKLDMIGKEEMNSTFIYLR
jgi:hypothetical protein